ncbi:putative membrane protein [Streptomyces sp. 846.5]|nr:SHOCT domain-containing protein [Streptomyces sp. 846.5]TDU02902.1 putative membrane protein [Streptomyces sp. 846.5]
MNTTLLADGWNGGPGPWILLVPLFWISAVVFVRRVVLGGRRFRGPRAEFGAAFGPRQAPAPSPVDTLNRRYAEGQIDEFEYRERYDLLTVGLPEPSLQKAAPKDAGPAAP